MTIAALMFFVGFFATLFDCKTREGALEMIVSEPYHDEDVPFVRSFKPSLVASVVLLAIAFGPPLTQTLRSNFPGAPAYTPDSPLPLTTGH